MQRTTLTQWQTLAAVAEAGGFHQAAAQLHKSPSSIHHAVQKLESLLAVTLIQVQGRKATLTPSGEALLRRARRLLQEAQDLETAASSLAAGTETQVRLAVDQVYPAELLAQVLSRFGADWPNTRIELYETVLSGGVERLYAGQVDILITGMPVQGFVGRPLSTARFICVAHPEHPLHQHEGELTYRDLRFHRQIVIRDSGTAHRVDAGWLEAEQRWTVSHVATSVRLLKQGMGFAWLPVHLIQGALAAGELKPLPLPEQGLRQVPLQLIQADEASAGPATRALVRLIQAYSFDV